MGRRASQRGAGLKVVIRQMQLAGIRDPLEEPIRIRLARRRARIKQPREKAFREIAEKRRASLESSPDRMTLTAFYRLKGIGRTSIRLAGGRKVIAPAAKEDQKRARFQATEEAMRDLFRRDPAAMGGKADEIAKSLWFDRHRIFKGRDHSRSTLLQTVRLLLPRWGSAKERRRRASLIRNK